jgi:hypothetical protein
VELVEQRRIADWRLRVTDQYRRTVGRLLAADDPRMAEPRTARAAPKRRHVDLLFQTVLPREFCHLGHPGIADIVPLDNGRRIVRL